MLKDSDHNSNQLAECIAYVKHKVRHTQARIKYRKPIPEQVVYFTTDMKIVIVHHKLTANEDLFVSHLVTFNETLM